MARPASTALLTREPTPSLSMVSNGETPKMPFSRYAVKKRGLHVVAGEAPHRLGQVVRAEGEELRGLGDLTGGQRGARQLDHRADASA